MPFEAHFHMRMSANDRPRFGGPLDFTFLYGKLNSTAGPEGPFGLRPALYNVCWSFILEHTLAQ